MAHRVPGTFTASRLLRIQRSGSLPTAPARPRCRPRSFLRTRAHPTRPPPAGARTGAVFHVRGRLGHVHRVCTVSTPRRCLWRDSHSRDDACSVRLELEFCFIRILLRVVETGLWRASVCTRNSDLGARFPGRVSPDASLCVALRTHPRRGRPGEGAPAWQHLAQRTPGAGHGRRSHRFSSATSIDVRGTPQLLVP